MAVALTYPCFTLYDLIFKSPIGLMSSLTGAPDHRQTSGDSALTTWQWAVCAWTVQARWSIPVATQISSMYHAYMSGMSGSEGQWEWNVLSSGETWGRGHPCRSTIFNINKYINTQSPVHCLDPSGRDIRDSLMYQGPLQTWFGD